MNSNKWLSPMDRSKDFFGAGALRHFVNGVQDKMDPSFGRVSSRKEEHDVKWRIARELGVEEEYHPNFFMAIDEAGEDGRDANCAVQERYDELRNKGKIQEDPAYARVKSKSLANSTGTR